METSGGPSLAIALEKAKQEFEERLTQEIRLYERQHEGELELDVTFEEDAGASNRGTPELIQTVRQHVDAFHHRQPVQTSGVYIYRVTAIDSDADGQIALNVKYEYPV